MASLILKALPESLHERLKESARRNHRSIRQEAIIVLDVGLRNLGDPVPPPPLPKPIKGSKKLTAKFIKDAIAEGRP